MSTMLPKIFNFRRKMASMKTRKDRVHYAVCQCKLFRNSAASTSSSVENELNFEDFWKFYVKYMDQLFGAKVSSSQRTGEFLFEVSLLNTLFNI